MELPLLPLTLARVPDGLRQALQQEGVPFRSWQPGEDATRFVLFDSRCAPRPPLVTGQEAIDVDQFRRGVESDPFQALIEPQAARHRWQLGPWEVSEEIATVNRRAVRKRLLMRLRKELERRGGVWMTVGYFPFPYRSAFNFRFDHDNYHPGDFDRTLAAIDGWEDATSHYVCASTHVEHADALRRLAGMHVGGHGYWHHTYRNREDNEHNIRRGLEVLRSTGLQPIGFVAPHGRHNPGLQAALDVLRIEHSSEFALAYDDVPFFPVRSGVLQVPIHPICLGVVMEAALAATREDPQAEVDYCQAVEVTIAHFQSVARQKYDAGEPIFLYGHPDGRVGRYPEVLRETLAAVANFSALWKTTLAEFARWWRKRLAIRLQLQRVGETLVVTGQMPPGNCRATLHLNRGDLVASLPWDGRELRLQTSALAYQRRPAKVAGFQPVRTDGPQPLKAALLRYLDWERVTPVAEIRVRDWRSLVKKTLRLIKP